MPLIFYVMLCTTCICQHFAHLHYSFSEGIIFQFRLYHQTSFHQVNFVFLLLQPLSQGVQKCLITLVVVMSVRGPNK
jgi:hypothetical protein